MGSVETPSTQGLDFDSADGSKCSSISWRVQTRQLRDVPGGKVG